MADTAVLAERPAKASAGLRVRRAVEADRLGLFKLAVAMHRETSFRAYAFNPQKAIDSLGAWIHGGLMVVAEKDGQVVGMLAGSKHSPWFSDDKVVSERLFYVAADHRGGRAGYMLMREFMAWARENAPCHVSAGVATGTGPAAERLYEHFGMTYQGGNFALDLPGEQA